ncbi:UDP-N-acetylmuramate dehydrogenase [Pasteuria penetrans]|uniref:UDP-N-acetylmuramate dehydrogenase n=1 Tax=Pasteuria penetrans TaxID=86005 RepID=UPI000FBFEAAA|nr:UDP-N-acetylmuramate dehydrogenase [Pasteuria penetrans]
MAAHEYDLKGCCEAFHRKWGLKILYQEPLASYTSWKIGGPADALIVVESEEQLMEIVPTLTQYGIPWFVLGRGSNVLIRDGGWRGVVIQLGAHLAKISVDGSHIRVGAGCSLVRLALTTARQGWTGLEFAAGIPGNVGGAVFMNAGAHGSEIADVLIHARVVNPQGEMMAFTREQLTFRYRFSCLQEGVQQYIVVSADFQLQPAEAGHCLARIAAYKEYRLRTQPISDPCSGSVFRNPPGDYAGRLIEAAGLKGHQIGDAQVSPLHGNFFLNRGSATAADMLALVDHVQGVVAEKFGRDLVPEIRVLGQDSILF